MPHILRCPACDSYGLAEECACNGRRVRVKPAKFSPEDKYAKYRRLAKQNVEN